MRKIILNLAVTLDGFIEGPNGEIDWLQQDAAGGAGDFFDEFLPTIDTIFYGRKSYDLWGNYKPAPDASPSETKLWDMVHSKKKYVFSNTKTSDNTDAVFINGQMTSNSELNKNNNNVNNNNVNNEGYLKTIGDPKANSNLKSSGDLKNNDDLKNNVDLKTNSDLETNGDLAINSDISSAVSQIKSQPGKNIWLYGGGSLITSFINNSLIDRYILAIYPVILGAGKPLFQNITHKTNLKLDKVESSSNVMLVYYDRIK